MVSKMKEIIEKMVKQEIRDILAESEEMIRDIVKNSLLPELRSAIRQTISQALEELIGKSPDLAQHQQVDNDVSPQQSEEVQQPESDSKTDLGHRTSENVQGPKSKVEGTTSNVVGHQISDIGPRTSDVGQLTGRYLYCVVESSEEMSFGKIGIEGNEVYTIPYEELSAIVHNCPAEPYKSEDKEIMNNWVMVHQSMIDQAWERFGTVLPLGFDTIIQGNETTSPEENMKNWLKQDYDNLKRKIEKINGKAEYGVQVFWDPKIIAKNVTEESPEIKKLNEEIKSKPKGLAYMYKQKLEGLMKKEMEGKADHDFKEFFERIKLCVDEIRVEKTKKAENEKQMLLNLSCLLPKEARGKLGDELEKISNRDGYSVRFTGPWPPYSFV